MPSSSKYQSRVLSRKFAKSWANRFPMATPLPSPFVKRDLLGGKKYEDGAVVALEAKGVAVLELS